MLKLEWNVFVTAQVPVVPNVLASQDKVEYDS
jgi:hypothetical protein